MINSRLLRRAALVIAAIALSAVAASPASAQGRGDRDDRRSDNSRKIYAVTSSNLLIQVTEKNPNRVVDLQSITGLGNASLVGIDYRPRTGDLYGVTSNSTLVRINAQTGIAIGENLDAMGNPIPFTPALMGNAFGIDFNPAADAVRVVSDQGQNLRLSPDGGTVAGVDGNLNPGTPMVVGAAYTNSSFNFTRPTTTTLFVLDAASDQVLVQNPPNAGTLTMGQPLGVNVQPGASWDIAGANNRGYLANPRRRGRGSTLYKVNPVTGATRQVGNIARNRFSLNGIAVEQDKVN